jgi:hypothetical protein
MADDDRILVSLLRPGEGPPPPWTRGAVARLTAAGLVELVPLGTWRLTDAGRDRALDLLYGRRPGPGG